jgi:hypothetical protein
MAAAIHEDDEYDVDQIAHYADVICEVNSTTWVVESQEYDLYIFLK